MTRFALVLLVLLISSCSSVPLRTMLELSSFDKDDFANIQPKDLRAKIQIDEPLRADIATAELALELETAQGLQVFNFPLVLLEELKIAPVSGLFSSSPGKTEYTLKLSDIAMQNFVATQQTMRSELAGNMSFSVKTSVDNIPREITEIRLSIFLKLSEEKGFMTLFDDAKLAVTHKG